MEPIDKNKVLQTPQRPAMVAYVPIDVFIFECVVGLLLFRLFGFWALAFFPIHLWFVIKSAIDPHWVSIWFANIAYTRFGWGYTVRNKGLHGRDVITFTASPLKGKNDQ